MLTSGPQSVSLMCSKARNPLLKARILKKRRGMSHMTKTYQHIQEFNKLENIAPKVTPISDTQNSAQNTKSQYVNQNVLPNLSDI